MDIRVFVIGRILVLTVTGQPTNIALRKPTQASSVYTDSISIHPGLVTDGKDDAMWDRHSCFGTAFKDVEPWWMVDLQAVYMIKGFMVLNRQDCCYERLKDFTVETFLENPVDFPAAAAALCVFYPGYPVPGKPEVVNCDTFVHGRYFRLRRTVSTTGEHLALCEVEVYEAPVRSMCYQFTGTINARMPHEKNVVVDTRVECARICSSMTCHAFNFRWAEVPKCQIVSRISGEPKHDPGWRFYKRKGCGNM